MRIPHMQLLPMPLAPMLGTRPLLRLGHPLGRLNREILVIVHRFLELIMITRMMIADAIPLDITATGKPASQALQLALQVGRAFLGFAPCEIDAFKVGVLLFQPGLRVLELGLQGGQ